MPFILKRCTHDIQGALDHRLTDRNVVQQGGPIHEPKSDAFLGGATERDPTVSLARVEVLASF